MSSTCIHDWFASDDKCARCGITWSEHIASIQIPPPFGAKCECGVAFLREGGLHSDYCPLYTKEAL